MTRPRYNPISACLGITLSLGTATALPHAPSGRLATCDAAARARQAAAVLGEVTSSWLGVFMQGAMMDVLAHGGRSLRQGST